MYETQKHKKDNKLRKIIKTVALFMRNKMHDIQSGLRK